MSDLGLESEQEVYDRDQPRYFVVEVLDEVASEYVVKPKVMDRGHKIYGERTVADLNSEYPSDDSVVVVREEPSGRKLYWPISRIKTEQES